MKAVQPAKTVDNIGEGCGNRRICHVREMSGPVDPVTVNFGLERFRGLFCCTTERDPGPGSGRSLER